MRAEAARLRAEAEQREFKASREALLTLAANYETVAAERLCSRLIKFVIRTLSREGGEGGSGSPGLVEQLD